MSVTLFVTSQHVGSELRYRRVSRHDRTRIIRRARQGDRPCFDIDYAFPTTSSYLSASAASAIENLDPPNPLQRDPPPPAPPKPPDLPHSGEVAALYNNLLFIPRTFHIHVPLARRAIHHACTPSPTRFSDAPVSSEEKKSCLRECISGSCHYIYRLFGCLPIPQWTA